jgi:hypothetical protein
MNCEVTDTNEKYNINRFDEKSMGLCAYQRFYFFHQLPGGERFADI